jgi:hypothetical protein
MQRPIWFRALITLWGIWFATALTEPAGLLACPMHSGLGQFMATAAMPAHQHAAVGTSVAAHHAPDHAAMAEMTGMASMNDAPSDVAASATSTPLPTKAPGEHHCCTCLGQCCTVAPAALVAPRIALVESVVREPEIAVFAPVSLYPARVAFALPFANGPPQA